MVNYLRFKLLFITAALLRGSLSTFAYDFEVDGIYYKQLSDSTVEVTYKEEGTPTETYIRDISIPSQVVYDGRTYNVSSIGNSSFSGCSGLTSINVPDGITLIGSAAFSGCSALTSIAIPERVTSIRNNTFADCSSLTTIKIPNSVTSIGSCAFWYCIGLTSVTIPDEVSSIEDYAFQGCSGLTDITIPDRITTIREQAFCQCSGLTSIIIPDGITTIGKSAFASCKGLTSVTIGKGVVFIGQSAFAYCEGLKEITCKPTTPPECGIDAFKKVSTTDCTLYIPESATEYRKTEPWSNFVNIVGGSTEIPQTCEAPTVTFDNDTKKLVFTNATEGAKCRYTVTSDDFNTIEKEADEAPMTGVYTITAYASADGMYNSEKTTAKLVWVSAAIESDGILTAKTDRGVIVSSNGNNVIIISGTVSGETIEIYNVGGSKLMEVKASDGNTTIAGLQSGNVYIVKIDGNNVKVAL